MIVASIVIGFFLFPANGWSNLEVFQLEGVCTARGIIPHNISSLESTVSEELTNKPTNTLTDPIALEDRWK